MLDGLPFAHLNCPVRSGLLAIHLNCGPKMGGLPAIHLNCSFVRTCPPDLWPGMDGLPVIHLNYGPMLDSLLPAVNSALAMDGRLTFSTFLCSICVQFRFHPVGFCFCFFLCFPMCPPSSHFTPPPTKVLGFWRHQGMSLGRRYSEDGSLLCCGSVLFSFV